MSCGRAEPIEQEKRALMISLEEYRSILEELTDELPEEFFRELSGGVIVSEETVIPEEFIDVRITAADEYDLTAEKA